MLNKKQTSLANLFKFDLAKALDGLEYPVSLPEVALMLEVKKNNYYALRLRIEDLERLGVLVADGIRKGYPCYWVYSQAEVDKAKYIAFCERVGKPPPVDESEPLPDGFTAFPSEKEAEPEKPEKPEKAKKAVPGGVETRLSALEQNLSKLTTLMETLAQSLAGSKPQEAIQQTLPSVPVPPIPVPPIPIPPVPVPPVPPIPEPPPTLQQLEEEFFGAQPKPQLTALQSLNFEEIWNNRHLDPNWDPKRPWMLLAQSETFQLYTCPARSWQAIWFREDQKPPSLWRQYFFPDHLKGSSFQLPSITAGKLVFQGMEGPKLRTEAEKWDAERKRTLPGLPSNPPPWVKEHDPLLGYWHDADNRMALIEGPDYPQWNPETEQYDQGKKPWPLYPEGRPYGWAWDMPTPPQRGISFHRRTIHKRDFVDPFNKPGYQPWRLEDKYIPEEWKLENRPKD